jgi:hypothetical protein
MHVLKYYHGAFYATALSNRLVEQNFQDSILTCYDIARPTFNKFAAYFKGKGYKPPINPLDRPFQAAFKTELYFF